MITRSACIKRAQAKMLQASTDSMYSKEDWSDFFQSSVMRIWHQLMDLKQSFFCKRKHEIAHIGNGFFQLPDDYFEPIWVAEANGEAFYEVGIRKEREDLRAGYVINTDKLIIVNWSDFPDSLFLDYRHYPKEFPDWDPALDNGNDPEIDSTYELDYPLNNQRGLRIISNMIPMMAKVKDGSVTDAEFQLFFNEELRNFMPRFFTHLTK
jgi:hypothetical protein